MPSGDAPPEFVLVATIPVPSVLIRPTVLLGSSTKMRVLPGPDVMPTGSETDSLADGAELYSSMWPNVPTGGLGAAKALPPPGAQKKRTEATKARTTMRDSAPDMGNRRAVSGIQNSFCGADDRHAALLNFCRLVQPLWLARSGDAPNLSKPSCVMCIPIIDRAQIPSEKKCATGHGV